MIEPPAAWVSASALPGPRVASSHCVLPWWEAEGALWGLCVGHQSHGEAPPSEPDLLTPRQD